MNNRRAHQHQPARALDRQDKRCPHDGYVLTNAASGWRRPDPRVMALLLAMRNCTVRQLASKASGSILVSNLLVTGQR